MTANFRTGLYRFYWKCEKWITPGLLPSQNLYADRVKANVHAGTRWLDIGCGHQLFPDWIKQQQELVSRAELVIGMDPDIESLSSHNTIEKRVAGLELPFRDASFDLVTMNMVVEHLSDPVEVFAQVRRVLRPGGLLLIHTPNFYNWRSWLSTIFPQDFKEKLIEILEQRAGKDVYATCYRANTHAAIRKVGGVAGFSAKEVLLVDTSITSRVFMGPFMFLDLLSVRLQRWEPLKNLRSNMIATLQADQPVNRAG